MVQLLRLLGLAAAVSIPSEDDHVLEHPPGIDVANWLEAPGARFVAVRFSAAGCSACVDDAPAWRDLIERFASQGLVVVEMTSKGPGGACLDARYPAHETRCFGMGHIRRAWRIPTNQPLGFLWNWRGRLLAERVGAARIAQILKDAPPRPRLRLFVQPGRSVSPELADALWNAVRRDGLVAPIRGTKPPAHAMPNTDRPCDHPVGAGPYELVVRPAGDRELEGSLYEQGQCIVRFETSVEPTPPPSYWFETDRAERDRRAEAIRSATATIIRQIRQTLRGSVEWPRLGANPVNTSPPLSSHQTHNDGGDPELMRIAQSWVGVPYRFGGTTRDGIDAAALARSVIRAYQGIDVGAQLTDQLHCGPLVWIDKKTPASSLQPGDLLFLVTYGYGPRNVMIYLGGGKTLQTSVVLGTRITLLPTRIAEAFHMVARRPERD